MKGPRPSPLDDGGKRAPHRVPRVIVAKGRAGQRKALRGEAEGYKRSGGGIRTHDLRVMSPTSYRCSTPRRWAGGSDLLSHPPRGQYRRRWGVARPCSGWERVGPPRCSHRPPVRCNSAQWPRAASSVAPMGGGRPAAPSGLRTAALHRSPCLHARPIHQVISLGPYPLARWETSSWGALRT